MLIRCRLPVLALLAVMLLAACGVTAPAPPLPGAGVTWMRPTPLPVGLTTPSDVTNLSNMPGADQAASAAVAPQPQPTWAAIIWTNTPPDAPAEGTVFVAVQDPATRAWRPAIGISTAPTGASGGHPDVAIDTLGRIHVVFGQDGLRPHYSRSDDYGRTWTAPEPLTVPPGYDRGAIYSRIAVDPAGQVQVVFAAGTGALDRYRVIHQQRPADARPGTPWQVSTRLFGGDKESRPALAFVARGSVVRTVVVAGCLVGCGEHAPVVAWRDGASGPWQRAMIPGAARMVSDQAINWTSIVALTRPGGQRWICVAWGSYARSANLAACSRDDGTSWEAAAPIITTPPLAADAEYTTSDTGSTPELLYDPASDHLIAVALYRQAGTPPATYPVYSYRTLDDDAWTPILSGPFAAHQPPLRLFTPTRRSAAVANLGLRAVYAGFGQALIAWQEHEADENLDVYVGWWTPAAMLAVEGRPTVVPPIPRLAARGPTAAPRRVAAPLPTATPWALPEQPAPLPPPDWDDDSPPPLDLPVWLGDGVGTVLEGYFYNTPRAPLTVDIVARRADWITLSGRGTSYPQALLAAGYRGLILRYYTAAEIEGPPTTNSSGPCDVSYDPLGNNVADVPGMFCREIHPHEDWFIHNGRGERLYLEWFPGRRTYAINVCHPDVRRYMLTRLSERRGGVHGLFLDNVEISSYKLNRQYRNSDGVTREYRDEAQFQACWSGFLAALAPLRANGGQLWGNLVCDPSQVNAWDAYLPHLDGVLSEAMFTGYQPLTPQRYATMLAKVERALSLGKGVVSAPRGAYNDPERHAFALASYLLTTDGERAFLRYGPDGHYRDWPDFPTYHLDLGRALGGRYAEGSGWRRDFERGSVFADPVTVQGTIAVQP